MRVVMISKALVIGAYHSKLKHLAAQPQLDLTAIVPPSWHDERGELKLERTPAAGYQLIVTPLRFNGNFHLHYYPQLNRLLQQLRPDLVHIDEEPYNLATFLALRSARRLGARTVSSAGKTCSALIRRPSVGSSVIPCGRLQRAL